MNAEQFAENERREAVCLDGIAAVRLYSEDQAQPADLAATLAEALRIAEGAILYAQLLEATMTVANNTHPLKIRAAAEASAKAWRARITTN